MYALPPELAPGRRDQVSGITCPTCHGSLEVRVEGAGHLHFTCRVGHSFSLTEVLTSLEEFLEDTVWAAIRASEELAALLHDAIDFRSRMPDGVPDGTYERRRRRAVDQAAALRAIVERNEPITFADEAPSTGPAGDVP
jgi:two-component system chemotaxis response regulator CheB